MVPYQIGTTVRNLVVIYLSTYLSIYSHSSFWDKIYSDLLMATEAALPYINKPSASPTAKSKEWSRGLKGVPIGSSAVHQSLQSQNWLLRIHHPPVEESYLVERAVTAGWAYPQGTATAICLLLSEQTDFMRSGGTR